MPTCVFTLIVLSLICRLPVWAAPVTVTFLHTNDLYLIEAQDGTGGFAKLMTLLKRERAANPNALTTFGGDFLSPSLLSGITQGQHMIDLMNAIGLQYAVPGNHDFDFGPRVFAQRLQASQAIWVAANLRHADGSALPALVDHVLMTVGGMQIGLFGLITPETPFLSGLGATYRFHDPLVTARAQVVALKNKGADFIVALTHLDWATDQALARQVPEIGLILAGHDHIAANIFVGDTLLVQAGTDAQWLAAVDVMLEYVERQGKRTLVTHYQWRMHTTAGVADDAAIAAHVETYLAQRDTGLQGVVGKTATALDTRREIVRTQESAFANLIADAMRASVQADVALLNGGSIRGDTRYATGTPLTRKMIVSELPFGNVTVKLEIAGRELLAALENGVAQVAQVTGRFPHVSGMRYVFDPTQPVGSRIVSVHVGDQPLDIRATYTLATNDYLADGGDGYRMLHGLKRLIDAAGGTLLATTVMDYIAKHGLVAPQREGRITRR